MTTRQAITFLGIGAQKSGTTWLHEMLTLHPQIGLPQQKELHYWDVQRSKGMSLDAYEQLFTNMSQPARGEITPGYAILPPETIGMLRNRYPDLRLLLTLRNPLERAWSHAKMYLVLRQIVDSEADVDDISDAWYIEHFLSDGSLRRGDYLTCIRNWTRYFDKSQMHISMYDDLKQDARRFLDGVCRHIDTNPNFYSEVATEVIQQPVAATHHPDIRRSLLPQLIEIYADKVAILSDFLGIDLKTRWLDPYT